MPICDNPTLTAFPHDLAKFRLSIDNKQPAVDYYVTKWLPTGGTEGATNHAQYGGFVRDAPLPATDAEIQAATGNGSAVATLPLPASYGDAPLIYAKVILARTKAQGWNGQNTFFQTTSGDDYTAGLAQINACAADGTMKCFPGFDMTTAWGNLSASALATAVAGVLGTNPSALWTNVYSGVTKYELLFYMADYNAAKAYWAASYWTSFVSSIAALGYNVVINTLTNSLSSSVYSVFDSHASHVGYGEWGSRNPANSAGLSGHAATVHGKNKRYLMPVSAWDSRPNGNVFDECNGFEQLTTSAALAVNELSAAYGDVLFGAVNNDYAEGNGSFAKTRNRDNGVARQAAGDIIARYLYALNHSKAMPAITVDALHVAVRPMLAPAIARLSSTRSAGTAYTTLAVQNLPATIPNGAVLLTREGERITVTAQANANATSITIASWTPLISYGAGSTLTQKTWSFTNPTAPSLANGAVTGGDRSQCNRRYISGSSPTSATDTVNVVDIATYLTADADVYVTTMGTVQTPYTASTSTSGEFHRYTLTTTGNVVVEVKRGGSTILGPLTLSVSASPTVQNMEYLTKSAYNPPASGGTLPTYPSPRTIVHAVDTKTNWGASDPILYPGEFAVQGGDFKVGRSGLHMSELPWHLYAGTAIYPETGRCFISRTILATAAIALNTVSGNVYWHPIFMPYDWAFSDFGLWVATAGNATGGTMAASVGIYRDNGKFQLPSSTSPTPLYSGSVTVSGGSNNTFRGCGQSGSGRMGMYWLAAEYHYTGTPTTHPTILGISSSIGLPPDPTNMGTRYQGLTVAGLNGMPTTAQTYSYSSGGFTPVVGIVAAVA